jgi:hypothetical protein
MSESKRSHVVPVGPGGVAGRVFRFCVMFITLGFAYPNVCIEGLDLTKIQDEYEGKLYAKK